VVRMYLTDDGRELLRNRLPRVNGELRRRVRSVLSDEDLRELRRMLDLLSGAMKD
jgi:DNA-binding MarR family transcriptional regulator